MNQGEKHLCDFLYERSGSFYTALMKAFFKADSLNFYKLKRGFPEEADAVWKYRNEEEYWDELESEYLRGE